MANARRKKDDKYLSAEQAEELFSAVDETGHANKGVAENEHKRRMLGQAPEAFDPLSEKDPSGSDVERRIKRTAVLFVVLTLVGVTAAQIIFGLIRRASTASLSENVSVQTVSQAMRNGVEWGDGFTQFPQVFTVDEADENTGKLEVTVTDESSTDALQSFSASQIQATALSINALLNPKINVVIYHVNVHVDEQGNFMKNQLFGFLSPAGEVHNFMTFIWTKQTSGSGINFSCAITGLDEKTTSGIRDKLQANITDRLLDAVPKSNDKATTDAATDATTIAATDAATDASSNATDTTAAATAEKNGTTDNTTTSTTESSSS